MKEPPHQCGFAVVDVADDDEVGGGFLVGGRLREESGDVGALVFVCGFGVGSGDVEAVEGVVEGLVVVSVVFGWDVGIGVGSCGWLGVGLGLFGFIACR